MCSWYDVTRMAPYLYGPKIHNLSLTMRKNQTNPNDGTLHRVTDNYSSKLASSLKTMKVTNRYHGE